MRSKPYNGELCKWSECDQQIWAQGYCARHYMWAKRRGMIPTIYKIKDNAAIRHPLYGVWWNMRYRGTHTSHRFRNYGGRGIAVCDRWRIGENGIPPFWCFVADMDNRPSPDHSIDRIDVNGDYSPDNCKWSTHKEQMNNTRFNLHITFDGRTMTLTQWCELLGVPYNTVRSRMRHGRSFVDAVTTGHLRRRRRSREATNGVVERPIIEVVESK